MIVCITAPEFEMPFGGETGGDYSIDGVSSSSVFNPANEGTGEHICRYWVTNQWGCTDTAEMKILVIDSFYAWIDTLDFICHLPGTILYAHVSDTGCFHYEWSTNETTDSIVVTQSGTYWLKVLNCLGGCMDSVGIDVYMTDFCDDSIPADWTSAKRFPLPNWSGSYKKLSDITKIVDADLIISQGFTLHLENVDFIMRNCSKIIVERGAKLIIDSSCIGSCDWEGIEVQGNIDGCSDDTTYSQGYLKITNSTITGANIAIYAGKRDRSGRDVFYGGGIVHAHHNHFENNYVDIMIQEWAFNMICACSTSSGQAFHHEIVSNYFGPLKGSYVCSDFVDPVIEEVNNFYDTFAGPSTACNFPYNADPLIRCHIIDLSPYPDIFWSNQPPSLPPAWQVLNGACCRALWDSRYLPFVNGNNCTYNNTFFDGCKNQIQGNFYHDHTK